MNIETDHENASSQQTETNPVINFLYKYDIGRIYKIQKKGKVKDKELLKMGEIRGKGRPFKHKGTDDIEMHSVVNKISILKERFNQFIDKFALKIVKFLGFVGNINTRGFNTRYEHLIKRFGLERIAVIYPYTEEILYRDIDFQKLETVLIFPDIFNTAFLPHINKHIQFIIMYFIDLILEKKIVNSLLAFNFEALNKLSKGNVFNFYFIISNFIYFLSFFVPRKSIVGICFFLFYNLDKMFSHSYKLYFISDQVLSIKDSTIQISDEEEHQIDEAFVKDFINFCNRNYQPGELDFKAGDFDYTQNYFISFILQDIDLLAHLQLFCEMFLDLKKFHHRLGEALKDRDSSSIV